MDVCPNALYKQLIKSIKKTVNEILAHTPAEDTVNRQISISANSLNGREGENGWPIRQILVT
jgi:hypothetical protein